MLFYILIAIVSVFGIISLCDWFRRDARLMRQIPGPKVWPLVGNAFKMLATPDEIFATGRSWRKEYGSLYQIHMMNLRYVIASDPDDLEKLMSSSEYISKSDSYRFLAPWLGDGLLLSNGKKWHQRRKLLTKAFHFNILKKFMVTFRQKTEHFVSQAEKETIKEKTDLLAFVGPAALHVLCETAMGISLDEDEALFNKYFNSVITMGECFVQRFTRFWLQQDFLFNLSKVGKLQVRVLSILHGFSDNVIKARRNLLKDTNIKQFDNNSASPEQIGKTALLDLLLENEKSGIIDSEGIREEVDTFMFEGFDTTTIALSFFLMAIANEPSIQDKIYEELHQVLGQHQRLATMEELNEMKYLECCIKESLRLYPSVPFIGRKLLKETVLSGYTIPANTNCIMVIYDLHRCADIFPDPLRFDPDRFLPENCLKRHPYAYLPFSAGLRNCIGQKFAMLEMKMLLSGLLRRYYVEPVTRPADIVFMGDIVLRTKDPIYVRFRLRNY